MSQIRPFHNLRTKRNVYVYVYMVELYEAEKPIFAIIDIIDIDLKSMSRQHLGLTTQFPSQGMG